jgi:peptidyl-prolyl cis-trans isomerase D
MLSYMRRHARSTTIKILFWIIIAVFVLWGVGTFTGSDSLYAASVNGETIAPQDVERTARQLERFYQQVYGENLTPELIKSLDFKNRALEQMIDTALLKQEAIRLGFSVTDEEVRAAIEEIQGLQVDGRFQREVYFRYLRMQGISPTDFEAQQRDRLLVQKMQELVTTSIRSDEAGARELYAFQNEKANLGFVRIKASDLAKEIQPSEAEIAKYYEDHRERFREADRVAIDYVSYDAKDFEKSVQVSDAEIEQEYNTYKTERYTDPEEVHVRHVLVAVPPGADEKRREELRERANGVRERLKQGADFATVAKEVSDDAATKDKGGDLGFITRGRAEEAVEDAAFALNAGEISEVIETRHGLHVIKVEERKAAHEKPLAEVRDEIAKSMRAERARDAARDAAFADAEKASGGRSLQELAQARGLGVASPPPFAQHEEILGLSRQREAVKAAFATPVGQVGPVITAGDSLILFRAREKIPSRVPDLKDIHAKVQEALRDERGAAEANKRAEAILKSLGEHKPLEEVAAAQNLTVEETGPFGRAGDYVPRIGPLPELKKAAFALGKEQPVAREAYAYLGDSYVVVLKDREPADMADFDKKKDELVRRRREEQQKAAVEALLNQLKRRASIRINSAALAPA